jgi:hypothetical protein
MKEPLILDQTFQDLLSQLEHGTGHLFVTGKAGTGKSTLLTLFRKTTQQKIAVLSPTGISALNVQGQTIHSFFRFPPRLLQAGDVRMIPQLTRLAKHLDMIVIDEISMVRADIMDAIDLSLRMHRKSPEPFGGLRMLFFGDLFQLPPVVSTPEERAFFQTVYESPYFFSAHVFRRGADFDMVELTQVYRQRERGFIQLLDRIRQMRFDQDDLDHLNERYRPDEAPEEPYLTLCGTNAAAQRINAARLDALPFSEVHYSADVSGDFNPKLFPTDVNLAIKEDAQVMMIRNHPERLYVNGTLGRILTISPDRIDVELSGEGGERKVIELQRMTWDMLRYTYMPEGPEPIRTEVTGSFTQYPVKLAWAVTIHKSQGQTYDRVRIDLGQGAFEHGQAYVALSRCRSFEGIYLQKPLTARDIMVDERVVEFYESHR